MGLSHISVNASMTIQETALTNNTTMSRLEAPDLTDNMDITVSPADDLLDGCKVEYLFCVITSCEIFQPIESTRLIHVLNLVQLYLCGLPAKKMEKLRRLVNTAGGLHFNQPSEELTHVVMGDLDQDLKTFISKANHR